MDKQKKGNSSVENDEKRQLESLIHKKNVQTKALKKLLKALEAEGSFPKDTPKS